MGDKLRNEIAISATWTKKEVNDYKLISSVALGSVYLIKDIPKENPADRARYLDEKLGIEDDGKEEKDILKIARTKSKALALKALERIAINRFF